MNTIGTLSWGSPLDKIRERPETEQPGTFGRPVLRVLTKAGRVEGITPAELEYPVLVTGLTYE